MFKCLDIPCDFSHARKPKYLESVTEESNRHRSRLQRALREGVDRVAVQGAVTAHVERLQSRVSDQEKSVTEDKLYVAEHYASKDFLSDLKREITDSVHKHYHGTLFTDDALDAADKRIAGRLVLEIIKAGSPPPSAPPTSRD